MQNVEIIRVMILQLCSVQLAMYYNCMFIKMYIIPLARNTGECNPSFRDGNAHVWT